MRPGAPRPIDRELAIGTWPGRNLSDDASLRLGVGLGMRRSGEQFEHARRLRAPISMVQVFWLWRAPVPCLNYSGQ